MIELYSLRQEMSSPQFSYTVKCCNQRDSSISGGMPEQPFQATCLWERIVAHLERTVKTGRHIIALRSHENCFHGSKAVDCLVPYLNTILPKPVKRAQVLVLCTKLFETGVIASVKEKPEFREKGLYRFTHSHFWTTPPTSSDSDELVPSKQTGLPASRSMECIQPPSPEHTLKGYVSDSTVTLTHTRKKKTRKISHNSSDNRRRLTDITLFTKHKLQSIAKRLHPDCSTAIAPVGKPAKSDPYLRPYKSTTRHKQQRRSQQLRDKENHCSTVQGKERRWSKLRQSKDWHHLAEVPSVLNSRAMNRSHSFSSCGELLALAQEKPVRHSGKWTAYGFI